MPDIRKLLQDFLFRVSVCMGLLLLCFAMRRLWPEGFGAFRENLFYRVDFGLVMRELRELGRCVLPR